MAQARRYFIDTKKPKQKIKMAKLIWYYAICQKLYVIETKLKTNNEKYQTRKMQAKPILAKLYHWLTKQNIVAKGA